MTEFVRLTQDARCRKRATANRLARKHLQWINKALVEEQPDVTELLRKADALGADAPTLLPVINDMLIGE
jgi:hypothetical protein